MKGVLAEVPESLLERRRRTGADQWDEMWNGVLHIPPMPTRAHQDFEHDLHCWLDECWAEPNGNRIHHNVNLASIGGWPHDYRIPDLVLLTPDRFHIDHNEYLEGPPLVVVEIRSPNDESLEKLEFYATLGVPEVWLIDRDTRQPDVYRRDGEAGQYRTVPPDRNGWVRSDATGVLLRRTEDDLLAIMIEGNDTTRATLPES